MQNIDTQVVHEYTKDLTVLYVEDDPIIQKQTQKFLKLLFKSVDIANDGQEALLKCDNNEFDIIITDIMMPNMDGLEFSKKIKSLNPNQNIIVTSAYNDSQQLIEFINLHIRQFMLKPVEINNMLYTLFSVAKSITDSNKLNNIVNILDMKLRQFSDDTQRETINLDIKTLEEVKKLELHKIDINNMEELLSKYVDILSKYDNFLNFTNSLYKLINNLNNTDSIYMESFIYTFKVWVTHLQKNEVDKASQLHTSMIKDIDSILKRV